MSKMMMAIGDEFFEAFARIPKKGQKKVQSFIKKYKQDPTSPGIHVEPLKHSKDPNLYSVRIDQAYRGIMLKPKNQNVHMLLWVDHHDKAYKWAENKVFQIHPRTGSIQLVNITETVKEVTITKRKPQKTKTTLFSRYGDDKILNLGVPELLIPLVMELENQEELEMMKKQLPKEAFEALYFLAVGFNYKEVLSEVEKDGKAKQVDTEDFIQALKEPDSKRRFFVVEDEEELDQVLDAPLEKWRVFLHPSQRKLVQKHLNGPFRLLGGAGTGKTVVAMHRAVWLANNVLESENEKVLFVTYTHNLAADIEQTVESLCSKKVKESIEVVNLDRWVVDFLKKNGYEYQIDYEERGRELWKEALDTARPELDYEDSFYRDEWDYVIQPNGISSKAEYLKVLRSGRGVNLSRKNRALIWPVFEEYRLLLNEENLRERDDAIRDARILLEEKGDVLTYKAIVIDEAQDMGKQAFKLLRQMIPGGDQPNDLFIVGDSHQRIYRYKVVLSHCGINIRGRGKKLKINYRTTDENRKWAEGILKGVEIDDLDGGLDDQKGYKSLIHGAEPTLHNFKSFDEELGFITDYLSKLDADELKGVCLVARTNQRINQYETFLKNKGFKTYMIKRRQAEDAGSEGVRLATMHRVKGLEFDRVIVTSVNDGLIPLKLEIEDYTDPALQEDSIVRERSLLYVAVTRARKEVVVTSFGKASAFIV